MLGRSKRQKGRGGDGFVVDGGGAGADVRRVRRVLRGGGAGVFPHARQPHGVSGGGRVGCLLRRDPCRIAYGVDARGVDAAATFAACACLLSFPSCLLLERRWRNRDMAAAVAYLQLHRPAPRPATPAAAPGSEWGTGLDATCARLARSYDLTRREEDVLRLLMEGRTFAEAADELVVSLNTVKSHVRRIYAKMGVNGKADLLEKVSSAI